MSCCCRPAEGATARAKPLALVLDRDGLTLLSETLGVIAALSFTIVCTGNTWLDFKDWIECGLHNNFHSHMSFSFQFGLAMLTTTAVTLFAIGAVDKDGGDKAWKRFLPFVIISLVVYIGVFVLLHVKLAMMLELHFTCQKKILLQELDPVNYPPASYNTTTVAEAKVNLFPEWGFYAFCVYLVPTSLMLFGAAAYANRAPKDLSEQDEESVQNPLFTAHVKQTSVVDPDVVQT